jgi:hypothetical protein
MRSPTIPSISTIRLLSLCLLGVISRPSYAQTQVETGKVERGPTGNTAVRLPLRLGAQRGDTAATCDAPVGDDVTQPRNVPTLLSDGTEKNRTGCAVT